MKLLRPSFIFRSFSSSTSSSVQLRPYQEDAIQACTNALASGETRIAVSMPTGSGKTFTFLNLLSRISPPASDPTAMRSLIIVSSVELARQTAAQARKLFPHWRVEIDQGSTKASSTADITIATYQTLRIWDRLVKYKPREFKAVVVDEAHHAAAPSYRLILSHFHPDVGEVEGKATYQPNRPVPLIGFSATFSRLDGVGLGLIFQQLVFHLDFLEMVKQRWLCDMRFTVARGNMNLRKVPVSRHSGDFNPIRLAKAVNSTEMNELVVNTWKEKAADRKSTLVFCVNINHLQALTKAFQASGVPALSIHGGTPRREREEFIEAFRNGRIPVLLNVMILTEGADIPNIDCLMIVRPTQSHTLFRQMIGRGTRLSVGTGKTDCHVIDFVDTADRARGVVSVSSLFGLDYSDRIENASDQDLSQRGAEKESDDRSDQHAELKTVKFVDYPDIFSFARQVPPVYQFSPLAWVDCGGGTYALPCMMGTDYIHVQKVRSSEGAPESFRAWHTLLQYGAVIKKTFILEKDNLRDIIQPCDIYAKTVVRRGQALRPLLRTALWRHRPAMPVDKGYVTELVRQHGLIEHDEERWEEVLASLTQDDVQRIVTRLRYGPIFRAEAGVPEEKQPPDCPGSDDIDSEKAGSIAKSEHSSDESNSPSGRGDSWLRKLGRALFGPK